MQKTIAILFILFLFASCTTYHKATSTDDGRIAVNFVQINDVYEIAPLDNGNAGGMARIATLKQQYVKQNPNTFLVIAGDFLSPSVYNSLAYNKEYIRGKQMVEAMNAAGMDIAIFGNHELDLKENELRLQAHPHPISGPMDFHQRLEFLRFHINRHKDQVSSLLNEMN